MPDDAATVLRRFADAFNARSMEAMLAVVDPEGTMRDHRPLGGWNGGVAEWRDTLRSWVPLLERLHAEVDVLRSDATRVASVLTGRGTDAIAGGPLEIVIYAVHTVRDGRLTTLDVFPDEQAALAHYEGAG